MPKLNFVKKARKTIRGTGIKKGDSYYWWKFRFGGKRVSKTRPRRSQLTESDFYASMWDWEDSLEVKGPFTADDCESLAGDLESIADEVESLGQDQDEKLNNMPDALQESDMGELLRSRSEGCERIADELRTAADTIRDLPDDEDDDAKNYADDAQEAIGQISWDCD